MSVSLTKPLSFVVVVGVVVIAPQKAPPVATSSACRARQLGAPVNPTIALAAAARDHLPQPV